MVLDQTILIVAGLAVVVILGIAFALFADSVESNARRSKRLSSIDKNRGRNADNTKNRMQAKAQQEVAARLARLNENNQKKSFFDIRGRLLEAGLTMSPAKFLMIFYALAAAAAAGCLIAGLQPVAAVGAAVIVAFALPRFVLKKLASRRRNKFLDILPNAVDVLVRGVRSGLPLTEGMKVVAHEIQDPVGSEFRQLVDANALGSSMEDAMGKMHERMPIAEVSFFRNVLIIQKQTGGNLSEALSNLSTILRDRKTMKGKIRALSAEARTSAIIIGALPFGVASAVYFTTPDYITLLFITDTGQMLLAGSLVWMSMGIWVMRSMVNFEV